MPKITLNNKEIARLEQKIAKPGIPKDEVAFIKFLIKKYKASQAKKVSARKRPLGWTFTWDGFTWAYRF